MTTIGALAVIGVVLLQLNVTRVRVARKPMTPVSWSWALGPGEPRALIAASTAFTVVLFLLAVHETGDKLLPYVLCGPAIAGPALSLVWISQHNRRLRPPVQLRRVD